MSAREHELADVRAARRIGDGAREAGADRPREMFCVASALCGEDDLAARLERAFLAARHFLATHSAADVVARALERPSHRQLVARAMDAAPAGAAAMPSFELHVGFMAPNAAGVDALLTDAAARAGFAHRHSRFPSAVIALELGALTGKRSVPTTILKAHSIDPDLAGRAVEAFVPHEESAVVGEWIAGGIGTHIGLKLASPSAIPEVVEAFLAEGYRLPGFLRGGAVVNAAEGSVVAYVERVAAGRALRIELFGEAVPPA